MKVRTGFVSNSSSSSFLLWLPKKPENIEETKEVFNIKQKRLDAYANFYLDAKQLQRDLEDAGITLDDVVRRLYEKLNEQSELTIDELKNRVQYGMLSTLADYILELIRGDEAERSREELYKDIMKHAEKIAKAMLANAKTENKYLIHVQFSDHDPVESILMYNYNFLFMYVQYLLLEGRA